MEGYGMTQLLVACLGPSRGNLNPRRGGGTVAERAPRNLSLSPLEEQLVDASIRT